MRITNALAVIAALVVIYDQLLGLPERQWLWEQGLVGGIYGLCFGVAVLGGLLAVVRTK